MKNLRNEKVSNRILSRTSNINVHNLFVLVYSSRIMDYPQVQVKLVISFVCIQVNVDITSKVEPMDNKRYIFPPKIPVPKDFDDYGN